MPQDRIDGPRTKRVTIHQEILTQMSGQTLTEISLSAHVSLRSPDTHGRHTGMPTELQPRKVPGSGRGQEHLRVVQVRRRFARRAARGRDGAGHAEPPLQSVWLETGL